MVNRFVTAQSAVEMRRWGAPATVTLAAMVALAALTADAAARQPAPPTEATAQREAGEPIMAIVSIKTQQVTFYDAEGWILCAPVSTGITGRETPAGVFAVIEKDKDHHSTLYDDAWMPNMQRITWNGIALHGGPLPGYAASHGCVRMPYGFAEKLFDQTWIGMQLHTARPAAKSKRDAAAAAKDAAKGAQTKKTDTAKAANDAKLALEPVSVYISRATQKLYVRRNTHKRWPDGGEVFDATIEVPVTIRNPDKPIGTHVFTAMARNAAGLRWTAVTIDNADDAKDALDRITIPQDVLHRIPPTAFPRSSIIVSDEPLSRETNYRTEFVAVLNNQPQGGFVTRRPTVDVPIASGNSWGDGGFGFFFQRNPDPQTGDTRRGGGQYYHRMQQGWW